jgi:outer membrane lipoprotein-sorting protein
LLTRSVSLFLLLALHAPAAPLSLPELFAKLDQNAGSFRSMSAKLERIDYTAVLKDASKEFGSILMLKKKNGSVAMRIDFNQPDVKQVSYADKKVQSYLPKINTVQIVDVGKIDSLISQGVLIGFGTSAKELQKTYNIRLLGEEAVNGKPATHLELIPKGDSPLMKLKKIEVWLANSDGYPLRQKLFQGAGDYNQATYSDLKINPNIVEKDVRLDLPKNVKKEYPSK